MTGVVIGWVGHHQHTPWQISQLDPLSLAFSATAFELLTLAPALLTAGRHLSLYRVIVVVGAENSRFRPKMYTYIFWLLPSSSARTSRHRWWHGGNG